MKKFFLCGVMAATLALASCTTTQLDDTIQRSLPVTCKLIETGHLSFVAATAAGDISQRTIDKELAAYTAIAPICANPESVTVATALPLAVQAYVVISKAMKEAKE